MLRVLATTECRSVESLSACVSDVARRQRTASPRTFPATLSPLRPSLGLRRRSLEAR